MTQPTTPAGRDDLGPVATFSRLDDHVLLGDAGQVLAMAAAGAHRLVDLRSETTPPRLDITIHHHPLTDLMDDQDDLILAAATHVHDLVTGGTCLGVYCMAGVSRTSTVAIAYLMLRGHSLSEATDEVRRVRPQALPAMQLWRSLERLARRLS